MKTKIYNTFTDKLRLLIIIILNFCIIPLFPSNNSPKQPENIDDSKQHIDENLLFYCFPPKTDLRPILIVVEGSYVHQEGPQSIIRLHEHFSKVVNEVDFGLVLMERRGISNTSVDKDIYHKFNTPSQRLDDHLKVVNFLLV